MTGRIETTVSPQTPPARRASNPSAVEVTPERIRERAYEIFRARNGAPGDALSDWLQAEREVRRASEAVAPAPRPVARRPSPAPRAAEGPMRTEILLRGVM